MVQSRKEPTISSADLNTALDEEPPRHSTQGKKTKPSASVPKPPAAKSGGSGLALMATIIAIAAVCGCGFLFYLLQGATSELASASDRIAQLEKSLELSDDESSQSVTALQANLKQAIKAVEFNESEIRKLWDTRNVNRRAIAANEDRVASLDKKINSDLDKLNKTLSAVEGQQGRDTKTLASMGDQVKSLQQQMAQAKRQLADINQVTSQIKGLNQLQVRVTSNEEAIEAIDAYRLNINRQLLELQQRVNRASAGQTP